MLNAEGFARIASSGADTLADIRAVMEAAWAGDLVHIDGPMMLALDDLASGKKAHYAGCTIYPSYCAVRNRIFVVETDEAWQHQATSARDAIHAALTTMTRHPRDLADWQDADTGEAA